MIPKTAVDLTLVEIEHYRTLQKSRQRSINQQLQQRMDRARQVADLAAALLKSRFSAERVVLFGSTLDPELFHERSDIDLAVWGLKSHEYYRAVGQMQSVDPVFSIDLLLFEEASEGLQKTILAEGIDL